METENALTTRNLIMKSAVDMVTVRLKTRT